MTRVGEARGGAWANVPTARAASASGARNACMPGMVADACGACIGFGVELRELPSAGVDSWLGLNRQHPDRSPAPPLAGVPDEAQKAHDSTALAPGIAQAVARLVGNTAHGRLTSTMRIDTANRFTNLLPKGPGTVPTHPL